MVGPGINGFDADMNKRLPYDPEAAKKLLAEAGYPNGFEVGMNCPNDRYVNDGDICQAVAANLARIGVKVNLQAETKGTYFPKILRATPASTCWAGRRHLRRAQRAQRADALRGRQGRRPVQPGRYCNPKVDELTAEDPVGNRQGQARRDDQGSLQAARDDIGHLPLHQQALAWGVANNVSWFSWPTTSCPSATCR
jgi:peptide/nickel transport system substrate-binding protein